jgi:hypothetical protein
MLSKLFTRYLQRGSSLAALLLAMVLGSAAQTPRRPTAESVCALRVAVGVLEAKGSEAQYAARTLADELSKENSGIQAVALENATSEAAFRAQAARLNADYLVLAKVKGDNTNEVVNGISVILGGGPVARSKRKYWVAYTLEESPTGRVVAATQKDGKEGKPNSDDGEAFRNAVGPARAEIAKAVAADAPQTLSLARLSRKHRCFTGLPPEVRSLTMKFDFRASEQKISYDYYLKGDLWRVHIRPKGAASPFIVLYNGDGVLTLNKSEGADYVRLPQVTEEDKIRSLLFGFLREADTEGLKHEIARAREPVKETLHGRACYLVEARTRADTFVQLYFDVQSGALLKKATLDENRKTEQEIVFDEYKEIAAGVRFPYRVTANGKNGPAELEFVEVELNPALSDEFFLRGSRN